MNHETEMLCNDALRYARTLLYSGAKHAEKESTRESQFCMDAGGALLALVIVVQRTLKEREDCSALREDYSELREENARLNTRLNDMAGDLNAADARHIARMPAARCELEDILDDTEKAADALRAERNYVRGQLLEVSNELVNVRRERDHALARLQVASKGIDDLIAKYS